MAVGDWYDVEDEVTGEVKEFRGHILTVCSQIGSEKNYLNLKFSIHLSYHLHMRKVKDFFTCKNLKNIPPIYHKRK